MSKRRPIADAERTATMVDLLRQMHDRHDNMSQSHVVVEEVSPATGWAAGRRWADVLILGVWPSKGMLLEGFEVKASRADLKRELAHLEKHQAVAQYCDRWWVLAWDRALLEGVQGIPDDWGILVTEPDAYGERDLIEVRKAADRTPEPWPRHFVCSLVRNANEQGAGAHYVARACLAAAERVRHDSEHARKGELEAVLRPLKEILYGEKSWSWPHVEPEDVVRLVMDRLRQGSLFAAPTETQP